MHPIKHFITITRHRHKVMRYCFACGLIWQGLTHDLSKYGPTEFWSGARNYLGTKSPHQEERLKKGYSEAWMHHKGRNRHHIEYWRDIDMKTHRYAPVKIPDRYVAECLCDRIAAAENYNRGSFDRRKVLEYYDREDPYLEKHPDTAKLLRSLIEMYVEKDKKETFEYVKAHLRSKTATY